MKYPKMIIFDYGQTLFNEESGFNGLEGTKKILNEYASNPGKVSAKEIQDFANTISKEMKEYKNELYPNNYLEIHNHQFQKYLYEYFNISFNISALELEKIFWDASTTFKLTDNIEKLLNYLESKNIKIGVISNLSMSGHTLEKRIKEYLPNIKFEFIMSTADYVFRKPHQRIFELALRKVNFIFGEEIDPNEVWYCGDNPDWDVKGSNNMKMGSIWYTGAIEEINNKEFDCEHLRINDWNELIVFLENMEN